MGSLSKLWSVFLYWVSSFATSDFDMTRLGSPDNSTGSEYVDRIRRDAAGLDL